MTIQPPQAPQTVSPARNAAGIGCMSSICLLGIFGWFLAAQSERASMQRNETMSVQLAQTQAMAAATARDRANSVTGIEMLGYLRATGPSAGGAAYEWATYAVTACAEGDDDHQAPRTAAAGAACFSEKLSTARATLSTLRALVVPPALTDAHRELLAMLEAEERALSIISESVNTLAPSIDRRRGRSTWRAVWTGDGPDIPGLDAARRADTIEWIQRRANWVQRMNRECDRVLRCVNREPAFGTGPVQIRCLWRHAVDALSGETPEYSVFADSESSLPACDGTRAPCHDPPGGYPAGHL